MPTRGRSLLAAQAVTVFLNQTYENKELIVLDDADCLSFPEGIDHPLIRYHRTCGDIWHQIPTKRNMVNELAQGWAIWHLDSDDFSIPTRMEEQVQRLEETGKAVTGYHSMPFFSEDTGKVHEYRSGTYYALGSSLCYLKSFWESNRFDEKKRTGSDTVFVRECRLAEQLDAIDSAGRMVARIHAGNTSEKNFRSSEFRELPFESLPEGFRALYAVR
jgi:hypothetical protein